MNITRFNPLAFDDEDIFINTSDKAGLAKIVKIQEAKSSKTLLAPDYTACGGDGGNHKLGCPVVRGKK